MEILNYLDTIPGLRAVDRTVSAQEVDPTDNGQLKYPVFFPPQDVNTTRLSEIIIDNKRYVASRREWNAPDRLIPVDKPSTLDINMLPIGDHFTVGEEENQREFEIAGTEEALVLRRMGADIKGRTDGLVTAAYRTVERDAFHLWGYGKIIQDDAQTGRTVETDFNFDTDRYQDESGSPWTSSTAYDNFLDWLIDAKSALNGSIGGAMMSRTKAALIKAAFTFPTGAPNTYAYIEQAIADELQIGSFRFVPNDDTLDPFNDGGTATTNTRIWPITHLAAVPADGRIGRTARAPIAGLGALASQFPGAQLNLRGALIAYSRLNDGKGLKVRSQLHHMSIPNESRVYVINIGTP